MQGGGDPDPALDAMRGELRFGVDGMTCASCARRVEQTLRDAPGVHDAAVNFATAQARLHVDPTLVDAEALAHAVRDAGYALEPLAPPNAREAPATRYAEEALEVRRRLIGAALFTAPVFALAMAGVEGAFSSWLQALLCAPVVFVFGAPFHRGALDRLRHRSANMDSLISLGTLAAYVYSLYAILAGEAIYFETAAVIVTLILLGRTFEARAKGRASDAVSKLLALGARDVARLRDGREERVPIEDLALGDTFVVRPGEKVATDAEIIEGSSSFDESAFTGESLPVDKAVGDALFGASLNLQGRVVARATNVGRDTALARIVRLVEETQGSKAPVQKLADSVAGVFVPAVIGAAALTLVGWLASGAELSTALRNAVAVLIIACPCALGLATPTAILVGSGRGAELGVLFKGAETFERSRAIDAVVFDKTGTLTTGEMSLSDVWAAGDEALLLRRAGSLEAASAHPIAAAVADGVRARKIELAPVDDFESVSGRGVRGRVDGVEVRVGTVRWMREWNVTLPEALTGWLTEREQRGGTAFAAAWEGRAHGGFAVSDRLRPEAIRAVAELRSLGVEVSLLTGDNRRTAEAIGAQLGIDDVRAEVLPEDKAAAVRELQGRGQRVAFVGDGVNDAPALTQADLGIAVGTGADIAIEAGGVVLLSGDPTRAVLGLRLARRTYRTIAQNLFWAFAYNAAAIPLAAAGLLDPMIAAGAMAFSSVSVVSNSLRLRGFR